MDLNYKGSVVTSGKVPKGVLGLIFDHLETRVLVSFTLEDEDDESDLRLCIGQKDFKVFVKGYLCDNIYHRGKVVIM